jgi:hypothetical protein
MLLEVDILRRCGIEWMKLDSTEQQTSVQMCHRGPWWFLLIDEMIERTGVHNVLHIYPTCEIFYLLSTDTKDRQLTSHPNDMQLS